MIDSKFLEQLFEASPVGSMLLLPNPPLFTIVAVNTAYLKPLGVLPESLIGKGVFEAFPSNPDSPESTDLSALHQSLQKVIRTGMPHKMDTVRYDLSTHEDAEDPARYWDAENIPVKDDAGKVSYILHTVVDVTIKNRTADELFGAMLAVKKAKEKLEISNRLLNKAQHIVRMGNWEYDTASDQLFWSEELYRIFGVEKKDDEPLHFADFARYIHPEDIDLVLAAKKNTEEHGAALDFEHRLLLDNGEQKVVHELGLLEFNEETNSFWLLGTITDITETARAKQAIAASEEKYRLLFYNSPLPKWIFTSETAQILDVNEAAVHHYGYSREEFLRMTHRDIEPEEEKSGFMHLQQYSDDEDTLVPFGRVIHQKKNGNQIWVEVTGQKLFYEGKECIIVVCNDVTEREHAVALLEETNQRFTYALKATSDAIWDWNLVDETLYWGEGFQTIFGYHLKALKNDISSWTDYIHPEDLKRVMKGIDEFLESRKINWIDQYRYLKSNGNYAYVVDKGFVVRDATGKATRMVGAMQDITKQKQEEQHLRLLESVITNTNDAVLITEAEPFDEPGPRIIYVNEAFTKMTGYSAEEVIGKSPRLLQGPNSNKKELAKLGKALRNWERYEITTVNYKKNGEEFWINFTVSPVANENGWFTHFIAIERDVTRRKNEEAQKAVLAEIGQLFKAETDLNKILEKVLERLVLFGSFNQAEAWIIGSDSNGMIRAALFLPGANESFPEKNQANQRILRGQGLVGKVWDEQSIQYQAIGPEQTLCGIPILHNQAVIGVFVMEFTGSEKTTAPFEYLFEKLGQQAGVDIKQKQLEQELNQIFSFAPDIICIAGTDGYFKKINRTASTLLEYTEEELLAVPFADFVHPDDRESTAVESQNLADGSQVIYFENRYLTKWGKVKWLAWTCTPSPEVGLIFAVAKDITDKKELENLLNKATSLARIGGWDLDLIKGTLYWSDITKDIHEVPRNFEPSLETAIQFYKQGSNRNLILEKIQLAMEYCTPWDVELQIVTALGNEKWVRAIGEAAAFNGKCIKLYGSFQDIDAQKKSEMALSAAFREKNTILESIGDAFFAVDKEWTVTYWNSQAEKMLEKPKDEMLGHHLWEVFSTSVDSTSYQKYYEAIDTNQAVYFEDYYPPLDKWYEISAYPSENGLSVYFKDISERKKAEEAIQLSNERYNLVTRATNDAIWDWNLLTNEVVRTGEGFTTLFGYSSAEANSDDDFWTKNTHSEDLQRVVDKRWPVLADAQATYWEDEYRFKKADGEYAHVFDRGYIIRNNMGKAIRVIGATQDISKLKENEIQLNELNEQLQKWAKELSDSNAELEQFAYVASHDLQEPLRMVTSFLTQLEKKYEHLLDERGKKYIFFAVDGATRMRQIILDLLEYSRVGRMHEHMEEIDLNDLVKEIELLFIKQIEEKAAIIQVSKLPMIHAHKTPIRQIFQNLISNALKYTGKNTLNEVIISAKELPLHWQFMVKDNGIGIAPRYFEKIFVIFQRLHNKDEFSGTGMGLAICKKIVEQSGGEIWVESEQGKGSTFYFTLKK